MPETINKKCAVIAYTLLLVAISLVPVCIHAQSARKIEQRGDEAFAGKDYYNAAKLYSAILYDSPLVKESPSVLYPFQPGSHGRMTQVKNEKRDEVMYKLAESYRLYNHFKEAMVQYERYIASQDTHFPLARLWYGQSLLASNEPQKAIVAFTDFLKYYKPKDNNAEKARQGIASANFVIANQSQKPKAVITKLQSTVSADGSDFALEKVNDSIFWFTTSRHELDKKKEKIFPVRLYAGNLNNNTSARINSLAGELNMATPSLSADGLTMYFTGWKNDAKTGATPYHLFYIARAATDSSWRSPVALPASVNANKFNAKQPYITRDGKYLLFASDQPGGAGKFDIWMIAMDGRKPVGKAINLGNSINTAGDDVTPFYDADSARLYFSSDGRIGMGGLDIYQANGQPAQNQWNTVTNLGAPFNSVRDDQYYRRETTSATAYLSSDRASSCCLEIFKAVNVKYTDTVKKDMGRNLTVVPDNFITVVPPVTDEDKMNRHLLDSINAIAIERNNVHFNFASAAIRSIDRPQLETIVLQLKKNPALHILIASFTDCVGSMARNILWARRRSESVKAYLVKKGIAESRINIDFFGKKHFILPCREGRFYNMAEQIANRRSDLILTKEINPKWRPSGKELDINPSELSPLYRSADINFDSRSYTGGIELPAKPTNDKSVNNKQDKTSAALAAAGNSKKTSALTNANTPAIKANNRTEETLLLNNSKQPADPAPVTTNTSRYNRPVQHNNIASVKPRNESIQSRERTGIATETTSIPQRDSGEIHKLSVNNVLDFVPRVKTGLVAEMIKRIPRKPLLLYSVSDSVRIDLYDNGVFDYDTVSVIYNKQLVSYKQLLQTNKPIRFYVKLSTDPAKNEMILFAENMGLTPPNSALMVITDGENKRTEVNVTSDLEHNTVIYFIKVKKEKQ